MHHITGLQNKNIRTLIRFVDCCSVLNVIFLSGLPIDTLTYLFFRMTSIIIVNLLIHFGWSVETFCRFRSLCDESASPKTPQITRCNNFIFAMVPAAPDTTADCCNFSAALVWCNTATFSSATACCATNLHSLCSNACFSTSSTVLPRRCVVSTARVLS